MVNINPTWIGYTQGVSKYFETFISKNTSDLYWVV
jgi:hypothetical protein